MKYRIQTLLIFFSILTIFISSAECLDMDRSDDIQRIAIEEGGIYSVTPWQRFLAFRSWSEYPGLGSEVLPYSYIKKKFTEFDLDGIELPEKFDLRIRAVSDVQDQGNWGTCWAFAATCIVESAYMVRTKKQDITSLSRI